MENDKWEKISSTWNNQIDGYVWFQSGGTLFCEAHPNIGRPHVHHHSVHYCQAIVNIITTITSPSHHHHHYHHHHHHHPHHDHHAHHAHHGGPGFSGKRWVGKHRSFLVNFVQSSDHVTMSLTGSLKAKMVCRIRTKTLGVKHGDGVIG